MDRNGEKETHVEEKVTILADGEDLDHDKALREAIQQATNLNPNFEVEKLEIDHEETDHWAEQFSALSYSYLKKYVQ